MAKRENRILQFSIAASMGGRTQYILNLWNSIDHNRFVFDFVTFSKEEDFKQELNLYPGTVYYLKNYPEKNKDEFIKEFSGILRRGYDAIEIHTSYWKDTIIEELALQAGIPKIIIHGHSTGITQITESNRDQEMSLIEKHNEVKKRLTEDMATDFWACSKECAKWLFYPHISDAKVRILHNTIDTGRFAYSQEMHRKAKADLGFQDSFVIGFVGRMEPVKNLEFLFDVFYECQRVRNDAKLIIVGGGSMRNALEQYTIDKGFREKVCFVGQRTNTEYYYNLMDCFLLPSLFEGFPISALEAQCSGLRCILSDKITDDVAVTENVKFLPISDKGKWVSEVLEISEGYDRRDASKYLLEKGFDTHSLVVKLEKLYEI